MRPSRFTESQMRAALREVRGGTPAVRVCRTLGITQTTFYRWRARLEPPSSAEGREVSALRAENRKLKEIVGDMLLKRLRS